MEKIQLDEIIRKIVKEEIEGRIQLLDILEGGDVSDMRITSNLSLGLFADVEQAIRDKENALGNPTISGRVLASTTEGTRSWIESSAKWGDIQGQIESQNDLILLLNAKEDLLGTPVTDGEMLVSQIDGTRSWQNITEDLLKHFLKTEHIEVSDGAEHHGFPVVLNESGKLDSSLVTAVQFIPQGSWTPTAGTEYPIGTEPLEIWRIADVGAGYTYLTGILTGKTAYNDNILLYYGNDEWALYAFDNDTSSFYLLDGSRAITADFNAGNRKLTLVEDGVEETDGATVGQLYDDTAIQSLVALNTAKVTGADRTLNNDGFGAVEAITALTQAEHDGISPKDTTLYVIIEG